MYIANIPTDNQPVAMAMRYNNIIYPVAMAMRYYTPLPWQQAVHWWGVFLQYVCDYLMSMRVATIRACDLTTPPF